MKMSRIAIATAVAVSALSAPAFAQSAGDWLLSVGVGYVVPKDDNGQLTSSDIDVSVGDSTQLTFTAEYFVWDNIGVELLAALPFTHDIELDGLGEVAETTQLPPTLSLQYHFPTGEQWTPFVGVGINYTTFWDTETKGALKGTDLKLDDSWGVALHAGVDLWLNERNGLRADVRWIDINTQAELNGDDIGDVEVDPWVFGFSYVHRF